MNKKNLFKTIMITLLIFIGLTWVIKTGTYSDAGVFSEGSFAPFGIANLFLVPLQSFQTFSQYGIYLLVVGGFYGKKRQDKFTEVAPGPGPIKWALDPDQL